MKVLAYTAQKKKLLTVYIFPYFKFLSLTSSLIAYSMLLCYATVQWAG